MKLQLKLNRALSRGKLAPGDRRLWLLMRSVALRIELRSTNVWLFEVFYRRLLIVLAVTAVVLWLAAATALFVWLNRMPNNQVRWHDLAAPWRWSDLRAKRGDTAILTGMEELKNKEFASGFYNLRAGVARSPGNVDGRFLLARLQAPYDPVRSVALMEEGLPHSYDEPKFLSGLLGLYGGFQIQQRALETVDGLLAGKHGSLSPESRTLLQQARVKLLLQQNRTAEAETALAELTDATVTQTAAFQALRIEVFLRSGKLDEARKWDEQRASTDIGSLRQRVELAVLREDSAALQSALIRLKSEAAVDPSVYLLAFHSWHRMKRGTFRDQAEAEYLRLFGTQDAALQALAAMAVNLDIPEVLLRTQQAAAAAGLSSFAFRVHRTELALRRGELEEAMRQLREWEGSIETLQPVQRFYPEFLKRLTRAVFSGTPDQRSYLMSHLASSRSQATLAVLVFAYDVFAKTGDWDGADQVLRLAETHFPYSAPVLAVRPTLDAKLAAIAAARVKPASTGPESAERGAVIQVPATDQLARAQLEKFLAQDEFVAARDLIRAIRGQKPEWLDTALGEVAALEVELSLLTLDQLSNRALVRTYLDRHRGEEDAQRLVGVIARLNKRGRAADARFLADELLVSPGATVAVQRAVRELNLPDDLTQLLATSEATLKALDGWIATQEWAQAERLLKRLKDRPPAWVAASAVPLKVREVRVWLGLDQRPQALAVLRELTLKSAESRGAAFALVRSFLAEEKPEVARLLAREIERLLPDEPAAIKLRKETEAEIPLAG